MSSRWQTRGLAAVAALSLAAGSALALAQTPGAGTGTGAGTSPGAAAPGAGATTTDGTTSGKSSSELGKSEKSFLRRAAQGNLAEIQLGKLAQEKGGDQAVKDFGERMVTDHSQANDKLASLAQSMNVELPTSVSKRDQKELAKLQGLSGAKFDKTYASRMRRDHRMDIRMFEREAKHGKDSQVKQFAESTLPTLKEHLALAEKLPGARHAASAEHTSAPTER